MGSVHRIPYKRLVATASLLAIVLVMSVMAAGAPARPKHGGIFKVAHIADAVGLDPHMVTAMTSQHMFEQVYSTLLRYDTELKIVPDLAESWTISKDGRTYTFRLRRGVKFHNGREFTSADVKYSYERLRTLAGPWSSWMAPIQDIATPDTYTVAIRLKGAFVPFLSIVASPNVAIVPRDVVQAHGNVQNVMVGTGPYRLAEYRPGQFLKLVRNPTYYNPELPYLDGIEIRIIPDEATRIAALRTGEVDAAQLLDPASPQVVQGDRQIRLSTFQMLRRHVLVVQTQMGPLKDVRVRQALMLGLDREEIIRLAIGGGAVLSGPISPAMAEWAVPVEKLSPFYKRDVSRAKQLLAEAGLPEGFTITMNASPEYGVHVPIAQVIQRQWRDIGVNVRIEVIEWGVLLDRWRKGTFEILNMPYAGRPEPYFETYERFHSSSTGNASRYSDKKMDELNEQAASMLDPKQRKRLYEEIQAYIVTQAPMIFVSSATEVYGLRDYVRGFVSYPTSWRPYLTVWLDK